MIDDKKYYYLKLRDKFFDSEEVIVLESVEDGFLYSNIYLKLLCKSSYYSRTEREIKVNTKLISIGRYTAILCRVSEMSIISALRVLGKLSLVRYEGDSLILKDLNIDVKRNRSIKIYKEWRTAVFERDNFTCKVCGTKGIKLNAHHIEKWADCEESRFDINNGITLCESCHKTVHKRKVNF